jgi:hypothetical protein
MKTNRSLAKGTGCSEVEAPYVSYSGRESKNLKTCFLDNNCKEGSTKTLF